MTETPKKPTKKKSKPVKVKVSPQHKMVIQPLTTDLPVGPHGGKTPNHGLLRIEAAAVFVSNLDNCTIEDLQKDARFAKIPTGTLLSWAYEDKWHEHRKKAYVALQARLMEETSKTLTDQLYHQTKALQKWDAHISSKLEGDKVLPRSWEGLMRVKLEIMDRLADTAKLAAQGLLDSTGKVQEKEDKATIAQPKIQLSPERVMQLAKLYTETGRNEVRNKLKAEHPENYADLTPQEEKKDEAEPTEEQQDSSAADPGAGADIIPEILPSVDSNPGFNKGNGT